MESHIYYMTTQTLVGATGFSARKRTPQFLVNNCNMFAATRLAQNLRSFRRCLK
jgi:hypothetical protein